MMLDTKKIRRDFPMFQNYHPKNGFPLTYLDNAATTFKPWPVIRAEERYYTDLTANAHRGDYELAHDVDVLFEEARSTIAHFINARDPREIAFTSGASMSLNIIAYGLEHRLQKGDEIVLSEAEHASNVLPWFGIAKRAGARVRYAPLDPVLGIVTPDSLASVMNARTKIVALAEVTNVLGGLNDSKKLAAIAHAGGALFVVDGAQSVPHLQTDVQATDCDFLAFSAHKLCGPTGVGVMYGKYELLVDMPPLLSGGGMNTRFDTCGDILLQKPPLKFEAGTQNMAGVLGLKKAVEYLTDIGLNHIAQHEKELHDYAMLRMQELDNIILYNPQAATGIITFNVRDVFAQDAATYFGSQGVYVRSGQHCAKILMDYLKTSATIRASTYFYNDRDDIDRLIEAAKKGGSFLDAYFA